MPKSGPPGHQKQGEGRHRGRRVTPNKSAFPCSSLRHLARLAAGANHKTRAKGFSRSGQNAKGMLDVSGQRAVLAFNRVEARLQIGGFDADDLFNGFVAERAMQRLKVDAEFDRIAWSRFSTTDVRFGSSACIAALLESGRRCPVLAGSPRERIDPWRTFAGNGQAM